MLSTRATLLAPINFPTKQRSHDVHNEPSGLLLLRTQQLRRTTQLFIKHKGMADIRASAHIVLQMMILRMQRCCQQLVDLRDLSRTIAAAFSVLAVVLAVIAAAVIAAVIAIKAIVCFVLLV